MAIGDTIRFRGRNERVLKELTLGRKTFQVLEELGGAGRERYRVFDRLAGPHGDYRAIHVVTRSKATEQRLAVLQRLANLRNSNVPFLVEYHRRGEHLYLVLTWSWGRSLAAYLDDVRANREQAISPFHACRLVRGLAHGLCQLHHRWNVNHGDIKPANLILAPRGAHLSTIDFGSAWLVERAASRDDGDGISGCYAAPEMQQQGQTPDFRSDQFSLGVVWFELLTGSIPYDGVGGKAGVASLRSAFSGKLIPPSQLPSSAASLPQRVWHLVDAAVVRSLALDRSERFPDRGAWLGALDEIHFAARQRTPLSRFNKWIADKLTRRITRPGGPNA